jgi:hypothetical protein
VTLPEIADVLAAEAPEIGSELSALEKLAADSCLGPGTEAKRFVSVVARHLSDMHIMFQQIRCACSKSSVRQTDEDVSSV